MFNSNVKMSGGEMRRMRRENEPGGYTRAQACKLIALSTDVNVVAKFSGHVNKRVVAASTRRLEVLSLQDKLSKENADAKLKRSQAAKKAAATRKAKKENTAPV